MQQLGTSARRAPFIWLFGLILLVTGTADSAFGANGSRGAKVPVLAKAALDRLAEREARARWSANARKIQRLTDPMYKQVFGSAALFGVDVYNPESVIAGPSLWFRVLILDKASVDVVDSPESAAQAISKRRYPVDSIQKSTMLAILLAKLLGYRVMVSGHQEDEGKDFSRGATATDAGWQQTIVYETDSAIEMAVRYWLNIGRDGTVVIGETRPVCQHNWYL